ncbi:hypothetical protein BJ170DRAFT_621298 [Xylariales sp. AK1849]|nr:hypothetical protein BJ170DRAFT_621298 [Xylariales sp. AK1849]
MTQPNLAFAHDNQGFPYNHRKHFLDYVGKNWCVGLTADNVNAKFICPQSLYHYWETDRIKEILDSDGMHMPATSIRKKYSQVLSILMWIDKPGCLGYFTDNDLCDAVLPLAGKPPQWPDDDVSALSLFRNFEECQWIFTPVKFESDVVMSGRKLDPRQVVPAKKEKALTEEDGVGDGCRIWKVRMHSCTDTDYCCNRLNENTVVFKELVIQEAPGESEEVRGPEELWRNEVNTYNHISTSEIPQFITTYHGSFQQSLNRTIVLEFANGKSLRHLFDSMPNGIPAALRKKFWSKMFDLLRGLETIHSQTDKAHRGVLKAIHQDIKPDNILVFWENNDEDEVPSCFKISDFGRSHVRKTSRDEEDPGGKHIGGNKMYGAPECCYTNLLAEHNARPLTSQADIWSMGTVFSETLIWSILGSDGRQDYREKRRKETNNEMDNAGYDGCFHDKTKRLESVDEFHRRAIQSRSASDKSTVASALVSEIILSHMLRPQGERLEADKIYDKWEQVDHRQSLNLPKITAGPSAESAALVPEISDPEITLFSQLTAEDHPELSVSPTALDNIESLWNDLQAKRKPGWAHFLKPPARIESEKLYWLRKTASQVARDRVFFVDTSENMHPYKTQVSRTLRVLGKILKSRELKGNSAHLATSGIIKTFKTSTALEREGETLSFQLPHLTVRESLGELVSTKIKDLNSGKIERLVLYFLTDGCWNSTVNMQEPFMMLAEHVKSDHLKSIGDPKTKVSVQLIQYGSNTAGLKQLQQIEQVIKSILGSYNIVSICNYLDNIDTILQARLVASVTHSTANTPRGNLTPNATLMSRGGAARVRLTSHGVTAQAPTQFQYA